jgi:glycosyltransferase involved in cell wall biosynthesis
MAPPPSVALTLTQCWHRVPGGSATSVLRLGSALAAAGSADVRGVLAGGDLRRPASLLPGRLPPEPWVPTVGSGALRTPLPLLYELWARGRGPSVESVTGPVDLVHVTLPLRVRCRSPLVATVHDLFPLSRPGDFTARGARLMRTGIEWIRANAAAVMVPSSTVAEQCREFGFPAERLHVVPWGASVRVPDDAEVAAVTSRHGLRSPYVLFLGTSEPRKNLLSLLRAVGRLDRPDVTLVVAGSRGWGPDLVGEFAGVPSPVFRAGFLAESDLPALLRGASSVVYPSLEEGFGMPVLEGMAAGAAVVTSRGTATEEVAGDGALLVDPLDVREIASALESLLDDPDGSAHLRERGRARAAGMTWSGSASLAAEVYREVLG